MDQGIGVITYPVSDLAQAKTLFRTLLGVEPYVDEAYYVGFRVGDQEIGLDPHGHRKGMTGPVVYLTVADIQSRLKQLLEAERRRAAGASGEGRLVGTVERGHDDRGGYGPGARHRLGAADACGCKRRERDDESQLLHRLTGRDARISSIASRRAT